MGWCRRARADEVGAVVPGHVVLIDMIDIPSQILISSPMLL